MKLCWDSSIILQQEIDFGKCSRNFLDSKELLFSYFQNFALVFCNFILSSYYADKFQKHLDKYFHMSFVSSQGGTPKKNA